MKQIITMNRITSLSKLRKPGAVSKQLRGDSGSVGATLIEILMSLMVMGIGLVSVASLFPISMLRSIQATKITNAVFLKFQCEDIIQALPNLIRDDYDASYPISPISGKKVLQNVEFTPRSKAWGRYGITDPIQLQYLDVVSVIDPIGAWYNSGSQDAKSYGKDPFGLHGAAGDPGNIWRFTANRKNAGYRFTDPNPNIARIEKELAFSTFGANDSWKPFLSSIEVTRNSATEVVLVDGNTDDLVVFEDSLNSGSIGRIVLVDANGKQSHVSRVSAIAGQTVTFSEALPNNGLYNAISEVRLELFELRYSCLITIRKQLTNLGFAGTYGNDGVDDDNSDGDNDPSTEADDGPNNGQNEIAWPGSDDKVRPMGGDLVIFFRRDFSALAEQVYSVENFNKGQVGIQPGDVTIRWTGNSEAKPRLREGSWVFDPVNGYWYQIRAVSVEGVDFAKILLDRSPEKTGKYLMVPDNVVDVVEFTAY
ncbi:MAG: type II secretion system protein [Planctomycetaceae bacterium]|nr:type II secretion system protein [Planctomycetaceae bacterium]